MHSIGLTFIVSSIANFIGFIGILIILVGALRATYEYIHKSMRARFPKARAILSYHLILGLDFLVGKDIIDTFLLHSATENLYADLATLLVVVLIRIVLSHFLEQEIQTLEKKNKR